MEFANAVFMYGDAVTLPFLDCSFHVVVCRFAAHHFGDTRVQFGEMVRCLKRGGQLVVADLVANDDPVVARRQNELEESRDPSHASLLSTGDLRDALEALGVVASHVDSREIVRPLAPWLAQTGASAAVIEQITAALRSEIKRRRVDRLRAARSRRRIVVRAALRFDHDSQARVNCTTQLSATD